MTGFNGHSHVWYVCLALLCFQKGHSWWCWIEWPFVSLTVLVSGSSDNWCSSRLVKEPLQHWAFFFSHTINDNLISTQPNLISFGQFNGNSLHTSINFVIVSFHFKSSMFFTFQFRLLNFFCSLVVLTIIQAEYFPSIHTIEVDSQLSIRESVH